MLFWPLLVISLLLIGLFLAGPPGDALTALQNAEVRMILLTVLGAGMAIAGAGRLLLRGGTETARFAVIWLAVFGGLASAYVWRNDMPAIVDRVYGELTPTVALTRTQGETVLRRGWDGHYRAEAEINGMPARMMIDTGSSMVLLPYERVSEFGIDPANLSYSIPVQTANGTSSVAPVRLSSIKVGAIAVFDVNAAVAQPGKLKMGLLGMSFLDKLSQSTFQGDQLILRN